MPLIERFAADTPDAAADAATLFAVYFFIATRFHYFRLYLPIILLLRFIVIQLITSHCFR